jgi:hypothetical protein
VVSLGIRRLLTATASSCLLAAMAPAGAQPPGDEPTADAADEVTERIREAQTQGGPYSKDLIDPLTTLSLQYLEQGRLALADAVIEQAMQVMRANYGLRTLEQAPLLRQRIRSEEERGNFAKAWELERALQRMAGANPDDLRSADVFHEIGDKRMDLLERYRSGERPPQLILGCYYNQRRSMFDQEQQPNCTAGSKDVAESAMLADAHRNYLRAIGVLLRQGRYADEQLLTLEQSLIESTYLYGGRYLPGRQSLGRLISYGVANGDSLSSRATALVHVADWDLLYEHRSRALEEYAETYEYLKRQGSSQAALDELFSPALPVVLPAFKPNPLAVATEPATGYVEVGFEILNVGTSRRIEILGASDNATRAAKDEVVRLIARSRFRPRTTDGDFARASQVVVRVALHD